MADVREFPYPNFNFRVVFGNNEAEGGFQEISGLGGEIAVHEYRAGNDKENLVRKVFGLGKTADVTLKRGVIGSRYIFQWMQDVRDGKRDAETYNKSVIITLLAEDRKTEVYEWTLQNARPMKYTGPALNGKSSDVAVEELVLSAEKISLTKPS